MMKLLVCLVLVGCGHAHREDHGSHANAHMHKKSHEELILAFNDPARDEWQRPQEVLALLGPLKGRRLVDLGSGSGYFSQKFAQAGALVVAADIDKTFNEFVESRKWGVETRLIDATDPKLAAGEFDLAFTCNTYHHIDHRVEYFKKVHRGLRERGILMVVDFDLPVRPWKEKKLGPGEKMRLPVELAEKELRQAGFVRFKVIRDLLPLQYVLLAYKN